MADSFELAYLYSRVCGSFSKAFLGARGAELSTYRGIGELWRAVFGSAAPELPGPRLVRIAERKFTGEALSGFRKLAACLPSDDRFVDTLGRKVEYAWVKAIAAAIRMKKPSCPPTSDPGLIPDFDPESFPDPAKMFSKGRFAWIDARSVDDQAVLENRLDKQYYIELWKAVDAISANKAGDIPRLVALEVELQNVIWTMRLRRYFKLDEKSIRDRLVALPDMDTVSSALESLEFAMDKRQDWKGWKWERLLGPDSSRSEWKLDVRLTESAARRLVFLSVRKSLHRYPFTYTPLYCHFKLKEFETALVSGLFEGVAIGSLPEETEAYAYSVTGGR